MSNFSLSDNMQRAGRQAHEESMRAHVQHICPEHLLLGLLGRDEATGNQETGAVKVLRELGINVEELRSRVRAIANETAGAAGGHSSLDDQAEVSYTPWSRSVIKQGFQIMRELGHGSLRTEHALLSFVEQVAKSVKQGNDRFETTLRKIAIIFNEFGITNDAVRRGVYERLGVDRAPQSGPEATDRFIERGSEEANGYAALAGGTEQVPAAESPAPAAPGKVKSKTPVSDYLCRDLTAMAREGKLDPVIGREGEVERCVEILGRRRKNNPVLLGEAGVGKTAVVEGLASVIASGKCPKYLANTRVLSLDLGALVAGTKYRGQLEERMKGLLAEVSRDPDIVLFIDELHTVIGSGGGEGSLDVANMLKPALARGEMRCVAATTTEEYRKYVEKDGALERRFQTVMVNPPSLEDTFLVLQGLREKYEVHHGVSYSDEVLRLIVSLADRYVTDRFFPDKAIDIMDEVGARVKKANDVVVAAVDRVALQAQLDALRVEEVRVAGERQYERAAEIRAEIEKKTKLIEAEQVERIPVKEEDVTFVVSRASGVPVSQVTSAEAARLLDMETVLGEAVIGQGDAVKVVSQAVRRSRAGLRAKRKPIGSFLFVGPTGVGKTETARALAKFMFGDESAMVRLDMSEYQESHSVAKLVGAPPGYVGFDQGGILTKAVRRRPYTVLLLDEIEKAHPDVYNTLLQLLDDGQLTDSQGRKVDFKNTIVIMTSNVGASAAISDPLGFTAALERRDESRATQNYESKLRDTFAPEFLNRIDEIVVFQSLQHDELCQIVRLMTNDLVERMREQGIEVSMSDEALDFLVEHGFDSKMGARPLARAIMTYVENPLSEALLRGRFEVGSKIELRVGEDDQLAIVPAPVQAAPVPALSR